MLCLWIPTFATADPLQAEFSWRENLLQKLAHIERGHSGQLGVYVKDLRSGITVSLRGEESWYLASSVKVPVAVAVLQLVEQDVITLDTKIRLAETDYVDGAGRTNRYRPGSLLSVRFLLEQMLLYSDNTASDLLIRVAGLEQINQLIRQNSSGLGTVTTLADVRRTLYSGFHPRASELQGRDFLRIKAQSDEQRRLKELAHLIGVAVSDFSLRDLDSAYDAYYETHLNAETLQAFAGFLEAAVSGRLLQPEMTSYLLELLFDVKTGTRRIKAGLPASMAFAHKTGTQHRRICDSGLAVATPISGKPNSELADSGGLLDQGGLLIVACSRNFSALADAETALRRVGEAITASGIWSANNTTIAGAYKHPL